MTDLNALLNVISNATRYQKTYLGKVFDNNDIEKRSRVLITIPDLGILKPNEGVWADIEQPIGVNVIPAIGDWVAVYFLGGDASKPVVRGIVTTIKDNVPATESGKRLLYKDKDTEISVDINSKKIMIVNKGDIEVSNDGGMKITNKGDVDITSDGNIKMDCTKLTINDNLEVD